MLLEGKTDAALERLKRTVKEDTDNIMAYITLGNILRKKGFPIRAAKIHRNLLVRGDIADTQIETVLYNLVLDYRANGLLDKATEMAERLVQRAKKNDAYQQLLIGLYEEKGEWEKAFSYRQSFDRWRKKQNQDILALYKVYSGLKLVNQKSEREGRLRFQEAVKLDKKCIPAYLYWGDSYRREQRDEDALHVWKTFTQKNPDWAHLAFTRLKEVLFDLGRYGEIEGIYSQVIGKNPKDATVYLNLAEMYQKQGRTEEAIDTCKKVIETYPDSIHGRYLLARLLKQNGDEAGALEQTFQALEKEVTNKRQYHCSGCGHTSQEPLWQCPECHRWNTYLTSESS